MMLRISFLFQLGARGGNYVALTSCEFFAGSEIPVVNQKENRSDLRVPKPPGFKPEISQEPGYSSSPSQMIYYLTLFWPPRADGG